MDILGGNKKMEIDLSKLRYVTFEYDDGRKESITKLDFLKLVEDMVEEDDYFGSNEVDSFLQYHTNDDFQNEVDAYASASGKSTEEVFSMLDAMFGR